MTHHRRQWPTSRADTVAPTCAPSYQGRWRERIIARDEAVTSPSLTRVYPLVVQRGRGCVHRGRRRQPLPRLQRRASPSSPPVTPIPAVNAAIHAQVDDVLHYCSSDFYLPAYADVCERLAALAPMHAATGVPLATPAPRPSRRPSSWPATTPAGRTRSPSSAPSTAARSAACRSPPASRRQRAGFGIVTPGSFHAPYADPYDHDALTGAAYIEQVLFKRLTDPDDVAAIFVEPIQGEGGYIVPATRLAGRSPPAVRRARDPPRHRRGAVGRRPHRARCGRASTTASSPTSCASARAWRAGCRWPASSPAARSWTGSRAATARRSAATRSPAPRRWPRSTSSSRASPPTPPTSARPLLDGLAALPSTQPLIEQVRGRGPDDRHRPPRPRHRRGRRAGLLPARPAGADVW